MDIDFDSDSDVDVDTELYLRDFEQITAVLNADEPSTSALHLPKLTRKTRATITSPIATTTTVSSLSIPSTSQSSQEISNIEEAIFINKLMDEKYQQLEQTFSECLIECQNKLKEIRETAMPRERDETFRYFICGKPYFKDRSGISAPPNSDTILMEKANMFDFSALTLLPGWTAKDKKQFTDLMLETSQNIKVQELLFKISKLKRESLKTGKDVDLEITNLSKEMINVKTKSLEKIALPLDKEYDWEVLAGKLSNRHVTQEYRAFWKLVHHPSINKTTWTKAEQKQLLEIAAKHNYQDWDKIAEELDTGRTCYQCFLYYKTNMSVTSTGKKWTKDEIEYLKRVVDYYKEDEFIPWGKVAAAMENRTKIQVYNKYNRLLVERKGRFLPEEDSIIWNCYHKYGLNYKKMTKFLPGRSITQLRTRFNILSEKNVSTSWTLEEDTSLLKLMENEDSQTQFYANITKHFPGKKREHIRARYQTLINWIKKNPNGDLSQAPRRSTRRLTHGSPYFDLHKAVENLEERIKLEVESKKSSKITKDSTDKEIEEEIIATLITELNDNSSSSECEDNGNTTPTDTKTVQSCSNNSIPPNIEIIRNILLLLNAQLQPAAFKKSDYYQKFPSLGEDKSISNSNVKATIKSYSKKAKITTVTPKKSLNVYGHCKLGPLTYVMPPNYATIIGCKSLAKLTAKNTSRPDININMLIRQNGVLREQMEILLERFNFLFTWPIRLSAILPPVANDTSVSCTSKTDGDDSNSEAEKVNKISLLKII